METPMTNLGKIERVNEKEREGYAYRREGNCREGVTAGEEGRNCILLQPP